MSFVVPYESDAVLLDILSIGDLFNFLRCQQAKFPCRKRFVQCKCSHAQTFEIQYRLSAVGQHALDLMEFPLMDRDERFTFLSCGKNFQSRLLADEPVGKRHTCGKRFAVCLRQLPANTHIVDLVDMFLRCKQVMRKVSVVCQKQKAFCILIQSSDGKQPHPAVLFRQKVKHRFSVSVFGRRQKPCRLVQHYVGKAAIVQRFSRNDNFRCLRVTLFLSLSHGSSVNEDKSLFDKLLHFTPGITSHRGDQLIDPFLCHTLSAFPVLQKFYHIFGHKGIGISGKDVCFMFIVTARFSKRKAFLAIAGLAALVVCFLLLFNGRTASGDSVNAADNEERIAYLQSLGWEVSSEPLETLSVSLPDPLCEPYLSYNALQLAQGFDLNAYCGRTLQRYTYAVTNYPGRTSGCQADLYLCNNAIVAGDIVCTGENGFMAGLAFPEKEP